MKDIEHTPAARQIALVASDTALRSSIRLLLNVSGIAVREYRTAREFLAPEPAWYDCLVIDSQLADMQVYRLCLEANRRDERVPIVVLATSPDALEFAKLAISNLRVIGKPFESDLLVGMIIEAAAAGPKDGGGDLAPQDARSVAP